MLGLEEVTGALKALDCLFGNRFRDAALARLINNVVNGDSLPDLCLQIGNDVTDLRDGAPLRCADSCCDPVDVNLSRLRIKADLGKAIIEQVNRALCVFNSHFVAQMHLCASLCEPHQRLELPSRDGNRPDSPLLSL